MGFLNKNIKQRVKTEKICDGYCIVSFKNSFIKTLKNDFAKQADEDYKLMQDSFKKNNGLPVIPLNYNANNVKYRMQIESAIDNEGIVGIQINNTNDYTFSNGDFNAIKDSLFNNNVEFLPFVNDDEILFISANNEQNIEKITDIIYPAIIKKRENAGLDIIKKDGFLNKDVPIGEKKYIEKIVLEMLSQGIYMGNQELALNLLSDDSHMVKIILQEKHRKDVEKILNFLAINYILLNDSLIIDQNDLDIVNNNIDDYVHGAVIVKDKNIYGLNQGRKISIAKAPERNKADIDQLIQKLKNKNEQQKDYQIDNDLYK